MIGSFARGPDAYSDVDVLIAVRDADFSAFVEHWPAVIARVTPTIFVRQIGPANKPTITAITPDYLRFDITISAATSQDAHGYDAAVPLFDHDGLAARTTFGTTAARDPLNRLSLISEDFLRVLGLLPVVVGRGEFLIGLTPVMLLRDYLIDLLLLENGRQRGGAKRLNPLLTDEQRHVLVNLPPLIPTRESVVEGHLACARLFLPRARRLTAAHGHPYPEEFERATLAYLRRTLGLALHVR